MATDKDRFGKDGVDGPQVSADDLWGLVGNIPDVLYRVDGEGRFAFVSPAIRSLIGFTPDELIGTSAADTYVDPVERKTMIDRVLSSGGTLEQYEVSLRHRDGRVVRASLSVRALFDRDGNFLGTEGSARDVTEGYLAREAVERAEHRYRQLVECLPDGVLIVRDGAVRYGNRAAVRLLGPSDTAADPQADPPAGLHEKPFTNFVPAPRRAFVDAWLAQAQQATGGARDHILRDEPLDVGDRDLFVDITAYPIKDADGNDSVQLVLHDITERKREEAMLHLGDRVFRNSPDMIAIVDVDFRYRLANDAFCEFNGIEQSRVDGTRVADVVGEPVFNDIVRPRMRLCLQGQSIQFETCIDSKARGRRCMEISYSPLASRRGVVEGLILVARDITDRKQAELSLQESEERVRALNENLEAQVERQTASLRDSERRFRVIAETSPAAIMLSEPGGGHMLFSNPAARRMFGYGEEEFARLPARALYANPDDWEDMLRRVRNAVEDHRHGECYRRKDGGSLWGAGSSRLTVMNGREVLVTVVSDISRLKAAEAALKRSETRLRDILETASDWYWEMGPDLRFAMVPPEVEMASGVPPGHFIGKTRWEAGGIDLDALSDREREKWLAHMDDLEKRRPFRDFEFTVQSKERGLRTFVVSGRPFHDDRGHFLGYRGSSRDITEQNRRGEILRNMSRAIEQSPLITFITDRNGVIEYVNPAFTATTGYTVEDAVGKTPRILKSPLTPRSVHKSMWRTILSGEIWQGEVRDVRKDGTEFWVQARIVPVRDEQGKATHFVAIHEDISERREALENIRAARDTAERATRTKDEFLANMSHELRTPLNAIIGFSELMRSQIYGPIGDEHYLEYVNDIHESGRHLLDVINDILDVSAIEIGKMNLMETDIDVGGVFRSVARMIEMRALEKSIRLTVADQPSTPRLYADERRVKQILLNLLSNAVKFTPDGGQVRLEGGIGSDGKITLGVRDTGIGMTEGDIGKALEPFGQVDSALARKYEGTGLGLTLAKELVELHGGRLTVESRPGEGSYVQAIFPPERTVRA